MIRVDDPSWSIFTYLLDSDGVWVVCPKCQGPAKIKVELTENQELPEIVKLVCTDCAHSAISKSSSNPQAPRCHGCGTRRIDRPISSHDTPGISFPLNRRERCTFCRRLKLGSDPYFGLRFFLRAQIGGKEFWALNSRHLADMRMFLGATLRERNPRIGLTLTAMARLPAWTKVASMRKRVVRSVDKMLATARQRGMQ